MYFPFFRARQFELLALRDTIETDISKDRIKPIIEPVIEGTRDIFRFCDEFDKVGASFIFVVNPSKGYYRRNEKKIHELISNCIERNRFIEFAMRISDSTPVKSIQSFIDEYAEFPVSLIHESSIHEVDDIKDCISSAKIFSHNIFIKDGTGARYRNKFGKYQNVLLEDCFNKLERNADYDGEEFFSDLVFTYEDEGYFGFGDFSIVGDHFSEGGGQARACAIHITYEDASSEELWVRHFLSDPREAVDDGATLASEAINQLVTFIDEHWESSDYTQAVKEFFNIYEAGKLTSLAYVKKLSMRHHLELIDRALS